MIAQDFFKKLFLNNLSSRVKKGFLVFLFFLNVFLMQGQNPGRYPIDSTAKWKVSNIMVNSETYEEEVYEKYEYFIHSDTTINSATYFKLYKSGVGYYDTTFYYDSIYVGAIRDEENKIYFLKKNESGEMLLFDYNLEIGDTIKSEIGKGKIIDRIDTLYDGRKCFVSSPELICTSTTLIEGVGHSGGIMEAPPCLHLGNFGHFLNCFSEKGSILYENHIGQVSCDDFINKTSRFPIKTTSEWRINYEVMDSDTTHTNGDELFTYFIENDTLINTDRYYKLYKTGIAYYDSPFPVNHLYIGAIRDEDNQLFFVEKNSTKEEFLYDFNLEKGDTILSSIEKGMVVASVEVLDDGRKKINITKTDFQRGECMNWNNSYFIEGIGSMGGVLFETPCNHVGYVENYLMCYKENDTLVYQSSLSPFQCDEQTIPLNSKVKESGQFSIYPIPASSDLKIDLKNLTGIGSSYAIYDMSGSLILLNTLPQGVNITEFDTRSLMNGIYFIKIFTETACFTQKFVVEHERF